MPEQNSYSREPEQKLKFEGPKVCRIERTVGVRNFGAAVVRTVSVSCQKEYFKYEYIYVHIEESGQFRRRASFF
jgi:hypothetical protein